MHIAEVQAFLFVLLMAPAPVSLTCCRVVGQSCAEFALDLLRRHGERGESSWRPGVYLPEQLFTDDHQQEREGLLDCLAVLPGTFTYRFSLMPPT